MKYLLILMSFAHCAFSQTVIYPLLQVDSTGQKVIVMTMDQAQKLDNATEFSPILFKESRNYAKLIDSLCIQTIELKSLEIAALQNEKRILSDTLLQVLENNKIEKQDNTIMQREYDRVINNYKISIEDSQHKLEKEKKKRTWVTRALIFSVVTLAFSLF